MTTQLFKTAYTPAGENAYNNPYLNVLGMKVGVKLAHAHRGHPIHHQQLHPG